MNNYRIVEISVDKLLLDLENPRHDILENQKETIREMLDDQGDKLANLAKDIVTEGINPSELPIVIPYEDDSGEYIVLEGNRRVVALKILLEPSLAKLGQKRSIQKLFGELSQRFNQNRLEKLQCVAFDQREDAIHWIQLKHTGENKGIGVVSWDAESVARFNERLGKPSLALQVVQFVREHGSLNDTTRKNLEDIPITNLARLVNDPNVRSALGLSLQNGELAADLPKEEVLKGLTKVVRDVANKNINVNDIRSKSDRQGYLQALKPSELPGQSATTIQPWNLQSISRQSGKATAHQKKSVPLSINRKTLIPPRCVLRIKHNRINKIYKELRLLEVDEFPNATAVMLRVFLELSLDEYIKNKGISLPSDPKLYQKLQKVADHLENSGILTKQLLKPVRVASSSSSPDALFSTNTLHAYVHNKDFAPKPSDLKTTWDNMQVFMEKIWA